MPILFFPGCDSEYDHNIVCGRFPAFDIYSGALALLLKDDGQDVRSFFVVTTTFLSRIDIVIYAVVWSSFTYVQFKSECPWRRRSIFVLGINALVGLVSGSFISWILMNRAMDYPISNIRFLVTLVFDLILCWCMLVFVGPISYPVCGGGGIWGL